MSPPLDKKIETPSRDLDAAAAIGGSTPPATGVPADAAAATTSKSVLLVTHENGVTVVRRFADLTAAGNYLLANGGSRLLYPERPRHCDDDTAMMEARS